MRAPPGQAIGAWLKRARLAAGWTQEALAERAGLSVSSISKLERAGRHRPRTETLQLLMNALQLPSEDQVALQQIVHGSPVTPPPVAPLADPGPGATPTDVTPVDDPTIPPFSVQTTGLVGREPLLHQLKEQLMGGPQQALCALHGLPGVGKTALAVALARDPVLLAHCSDGVLWVGLGRAPSLREVLSRWASLLGMVPTDLTQLQTFQDWSVAVRAAIGGRRLLLVIDDAWSVEEALACQVGGPNCVHLLTTRSTEVALQFAGTGAVCVPELDPTAGHQLLTQLAPTAVAAEPEAAQHLVQAAGGLPLALVLMGRYLHAEAYHRQPRRLQAALEHLRAATERLRLERPLPPGDHVPGLPPGASLSLAASIDLSYQALSKPTRSLLLALSVFPAKPNTFSEAAALAVADCSSQALDRLSNTGLLESRGPGRYTLHQTIADYARLKHHRAAPSRRLAVYFADYVAVHHRDYALLDQESSNILAALQAAFDQEMPTTLVQGVTAFAPFLLMRGDYMTADACLTRAQQAAQSSGQVDDLATVYLYLGRLAEKRGEYMLAEAALQDGVTLARQTGKRSPLSALLQTLGQVQAKRGDPQQAERSYQESLQVASENGDQEMISLLLRSLGGVAHKRGDVAQAARYYEQALDLARQVGRQEHILVLLSNLGVVALTQGDFIQAEAYLQEGLGLSRQIGDRENTSRLLTNLGVVATQRADHAQAEVYQQEALDLARQIGHREMMAVLLTNLGDLAGKREDDVQAQALFQEGLSLARQLNHRYLISYNLEEWGELHLRQGHLDQASAAYSEALVIAREVQGQEVLALSFYGLARVSRAQGDLALALQQGQESLRLLEAIGHARSADVQQWLARLPVFVNGRIIKRAE